MKVVTSLSGGLDSTVLLYILREDGLRPHALGFDYGQRHAKELEFAARTAERLDVDYTNVNLSAITGLIARGSQLTETPVPEGHYADESMKQTIVPNRNMILLSIAVGYAARIGAEQVYYGAHAGDHSIYPDCRPEFVMALHNAILRGNAWENNNKSIDLRAPFISYTKADIVRRGAAIGVPFEETWSCYKGGEKHCGKCGTCVERKEAFARSRVTDPTEYES